MKNVICVSFPRSGQTIFEFLMEEYFGKKFCHADSHAYNGKIPCPVLNVNCHKTHDFSLNVDTSLDFNYVIRIRSPLEAIISWYKLNFSKGIWDSNFDNKQFFIKFLNEKAIFWNFFVEKWIISNKNNYFLFKYNNFILNPKHELKRVIVDVFEESLDENKLDKIIIDNKIECKNDIRDFKYFEIKELEDIESSLSDSIHLLNLPSYFI